jgi:hypothetical protein
MTLDFIKSRIDELQRISLELLLEPKGKEKLVSHLPQLIYKLIIRFTIEFINSSYIKGTCGIMHLWFEPL